MAENAHMNIFGLVVDVYPAEVDSAMVVEVKTASMDEDGHGPKPLRIYLNDHCVYENPPFPDPLRPEDITAEFLESNPQRRTDEGEWGWDKLANEFGWYVYPPWSDWRSEADEFDNAAAAAAFIRTHFNRGSAPGLAIQAKVLLDQMQLRYPTSESPLLDDVSAFLESIAMR